MINAPTGNGEISINDISVGADFSMAYLIWLPPEANTCTGRYQYSCHRPMQCFLFISSGHNNTPSYNVCSNGNDL